MLKSNRYFALCLVAALILLTACAHYPLDMSKAEWNRLTPEQQLEARTEQAALDQERTIAREKARQEQELRKAEQARLRMEQDIADGMIARFGEICIGGTRCPDRDKKMHIYALREFVFVDKIEFTANDNLGNKHGATIAIYADNGLVADNVDIKREGSTQTLFVGAVARNIVLRIRNDDEVIIEQLKVFGQPLDPGTTRIIVNPTSPDTATQ